MGMALSDEEYADFTGLEAIEGDDPVLRAGKAMVSRFRTWLRSNERRQHERAAWAALFDDFDVVLAPVMPTAAFTHDVERTLMERTLDIEGVDVPHATLIAWCGAIGSVLLPVVVVPTGLTPSGLPVGVQVVGPFLSDRRLLHIASLLDTAAGPGYQPPPV